MGVSKKLVAPVLQDDPGVGGTVAGTFFATGWLVNWVLHARLIGRKNNAWQEKKP